MVELQRSFGDFLENGSHPKRARRKKRLKFLTSKCSTRFPWEWSPKLCNHLQIFHDLFDIYLWVSHSHHESNRPAIKVLLTEIGAKGERTLVHRGMIMILILRVSKSVKLVSPSTLFFLATICIPTQSTQPLNYLTYTVMRFLIYTSSFSHYLEWFLIWGGFSLPWEYYKYY